VPLFPSCSERGVILSQLASWEDYGITVSTLCPTTRSTEDVFDRSIAPSFSCELVSSIDTSRSTVERSSVLHVFIFIDAVVESADDIPTHPTSHQLCMFTTIVGGICTVNNNCGKNFESLLFVGKIQRVHYFLDILLMFYKEFYMGIFTL